MEAEQIGGKYYEEKKLKGEPIWRGKKKGETIRCTYHIKIFFF
jgi:hypothetical protein